MVIVMEIFRLVSRQRTQQHTDSAASPFLLLLHSQRNFLHVFKRLPHQHAAFISRLHCSLPTLVLKTGRRYLSLCSPNQQASRCSPHELRLLLFSVFFFFFFSPPPLSSRPRFLPGRRSSESFDLEEVSDIPSCFDIHILEEACKASNQS